MFLTTNRVGSFDSAFQSRINLAVKYPALSHDSRRDLWKQFISRASPESSPSWVGSFDRLASKNLNGRQIKNVVRTAHALAVSRNIRMTIDHINMALRAMETFEADFAEDVAKRGAEEGNPAAGERTSKRQRTE